MKRLAAWALTALVGGLAAATPERASCDPAEPTVILISLDGVRHDYPERRALPALGRLEREGLRAALAPVAPASTFPSHVSLATGAPPSVHGILDNRFWDPERGLFDYASDASWIEAEPLWVTAERQGVATATFFWVGSETDWRGLGASRRRAPFDSRVGEAEKVAQILAWLDEPQPARLILSWWHGADRAGHRRGPDHAEVDAALAEQDAHLADLLAGLDARGAWSHTTLLVVSDHGMTTAERAIPLARRLAAAGLEPPRVLGSAVAHLHYDSEADIERAERALADLAGLRVDRREALGDSGLGHPTRSGDLIARARPGYHFRPDGLGRRLARWFGRRRGLHGYGLPHPDMPAIFFALGRCVPGGVRVATPVSSLDVAPSAAALLGIDPPAQARGRPLEVLRSACASAL